MKRSSIIAVVVVLIAMLPITALCQEQPAPPTQPEQPAEPEKPEQSEKVDFAGVLIDPDTRLPAIGVKLSLVEPGEYFAVTGPQGRFVFKDIPTGVYAYMFAYERGETEPARTILLRKKFSLVLPEGAIPSFDRTHLLERNANVKPPMANIVFRDRRDRAHSRTIVMAESLGLAWPEEYVTYTIPFPPYSCRRPTLRVADGSTGNEVPFQLSGVEYAKDDSIASCRITFPAVLKPYQKKVYVMAYEWTEGFEDPKYETDLKVETLDDTGEQIVSNSLIALRLPPASSTEPMPATSCPAPILAVRGADGIWFGKGALLSDRTVTSFTCEETEKGPLFKEFKITYIFAPKESAEEEKEEDAEVKAEAQPDEYLLIIRLFARRDYVIINEVMNGDVDLSFRFSVSDLAPDISLQARNGAAHFGLVPKAPAKGEETLAVLRASNPPGLRRSHNWYGLTTSSGDRKDAIGLIQVSGSEWQFMDAPLWSNGAWLVQSEEKNDVRVMATKDSGVYFDLPYRFRTRQLALAVFDRTRNWGTKAPDGAEPKKELSHHLNRLHFQLSQLSVTTMGAAQLNLARSSGRPHLLFNAATFPALKEKFDKDPSSFPLVLHDVFTGSRINSSLVRGNILAGINIMREAFAGTWNERRLSGFSSARLDPRLMGPIVKYTALLYDAHANSRLFSAHENEAILATFALVAAQFENQGWQPNFTHNELAVASRDSTIAIVSLLLDKHPKSAIRVLNVRKQLQRELQRTNSMGGMQNDPALTLRALNIWAELAPIFDNAVGVMQVRRSAVELPEFATALSLLPYLTTPPDKRYGGLRLFPTMGQSQAEDTEPLAAAGIAAIRFQRYAPALAGTLAWAWEQADKPLFRPNSRHRDLLRILDPEDAKVEPAAPENVASAVLPGFGALIRTQFAKPDEAYLLFKCSADANSMHQDQGSLLFHAFGTPLLLDPPATRGGRAAWAHNTVRIGGRSHRSPGRLVEFVEQDQDTFAVGEIEVDALSEFKEYTPWEIDAAAKAAKAAGKPFVLPPGHHANAGQTDIMLPMAQKLDTPVTIRRHVLFNKSHQYAVVYDRIEGYESSDVFYNVLADEARIEGNVITFAGPFGVDLKIHAFGPKEMKITLNKSAGRHWTVRLSQPAPPRPAETEEEKKDEDSEDEADEKKPERPVTEYFTILCPSRRRVPGERDDVVEHAAPKIERIEGLRAVRISYGKTVRHIFLANEPIEYKHNGLVFKGTRGIVTTRPTHFDAALFAAGEVHYQGRGVAVDHGRAQFTVSPNGFVQGRISGPDDKRITFYNLGWSLRRITYRVDGVEYLGDGDGEKAVFGAAAGSHAVSVRPR